jgi:hypothetical protein
MATVEQVKEILLQRKQEAKQIREEYWKNLKPFNTVDDIPNLPVVDKNEWDNFYVPILIRCGAIPKDKLIPGKIYKGTCRNADIATWTGTKFIYNRTKFGTTYNEEINHFEDDDGSDLFVPLYKLDV